MNDVFDELESQLRGAVRAKRTLPRSWMRRGRRRTAAIVILAMLLISTAALAAGGVIHIGRPAESGVPGSRLAELHTGAVVKGTPRLLGVSTADPVGGPAWGLRVYSKKAGEGCLEAGRLVDGKLGAIGQDNAFHDDGQFHEFAPDTFGAKRTCSLLDGNRRLFVNATVGDLPASAWEGFISGTCVPATATHAERFADNGSPYAVCPPADERDLYYGLLGPEAKSITYALDGHSHTQATVGPEGAYLLVTTASPTQLFNFSAGGTQNVVPVDGPITELHYRGGATCHLTSRSWMGGKDACTPALGMPVGWTPFKTSAPGATEVSAPVQVHLLRAHTGGYEAIVQFTSRVAITSSRSTYWVQWHEAGTAAKIRSFGKPSPTFPTAGETETMRLGRGLGRGLHPGVLTGEVLFQDQTGPGNLEEGGGTVQRTVGRFQLTVP